jgi:hypothetical protein
MGTNDHDGGVLCRQIDGTWGQGTGTAQTPWFRNSRHFWRWLTRHDDLQGVRRPCRTEERGHDHDTTEP